MHCISIQESDEFKGYADSDGLYINKQAAVGAVQDDVPDDVKDWSTEHRPSGLLFTPLKVFHCLHASAIPFQY